MSFMKWMRKNNKKLMAVVVIVLMVAFIGGSSFSFLMRGSGGMNKAVAYYGDKQKITHYDRMIADQELKLLEELGAADLLRNQQDLRSLLLSELLFAQSRDSAAVLEMARQLIQRGQYRISERQLSDMYTSRTAPSDIYWILLGREAEAAGIYVRSQDVGEMLGRNVPYMFQGATYPQMMKIWVSRHGMPEARILATFGKLLAVLQYAQVISSMENITTSQIRHLASSESETLDAEYVSLEASAFADKQQTPSEEAMLRQFNPYKESIPGDVTEANPYGFGYRLPNRVQLDYIALKLSDVAAIIKQPTEEDAEQYYQQNRARQYTEKVPVDPNDPNSPQIDKIKSFIEVADDILSELKRQRIMTRAELILQEARNLADAELPRTVADGNEPTSARRKEKAGDYATIAQNLSSRNSITLYNGTTGLLSAVDIRNDKHLRRMYLTGYGRSPVPLSQILFSVKELGDDATILLSAQEAEMYASIGPVRDPMSASIPDLSNQIMLITRVIAAEPDAAPAGLDVGYDTRTLDLGETPEKQDNTFSVKEQVLKDLRTLAAWDTTRAKAEEFLAMATKDGWDQAVAQFNKLYGEQAKADPNDPNVFKLDRRMGVQKISATDLQVLAAQLSNSPAAGIYLKEAEVESRFVDGLHSLAPANAGTGVQLPTIMEFKPGRSYYVVKSLSAQPLYQEQFQKMKGMVIGREEYGQAQSLAVVHLNPANIIKRMNFRFADQDDQRAQDKARESSKDAS